MSNTWVNSLITELDGESDRGSVVLAASYVDELLAELLVTKFVSDEDARKLVSPSGEIRGLNLRASLAFALGLIDKTDLRDIKTLAKLRNAFAHRTIATLRSNTDLKKRIDRGALREISIDDPHYSFHQTQVVAEMKILATCLVAKLGNTLAELGTIKVKP